MTAASNFCGSHDSTTYQGVACSHAYTIINSYTHTRADSSQVKLLLVRNPWGAEQYSGPWSDNWEGWEQHDKDELAANGPGYFGQNNEGLFYIDIDSYLVNFSRTQINQDTHDWHLKWFLRRDDDGSNNFTGSCSGWGHTLKIKNDGAEQDIWVGGHVW